MWRKALLTSIMFAGGFCFAQEAQTSSRAIFMSTAGSTIMSDVEKQPTNRPVAKKSSEEKTLKQDIPAGVSVEVIKVLEDGSTQNVNPSKYKFKTGDRFKIGFQTNLPGFVNVYNITADNRIIPLGVYQVPAFEKVILPSEAEFMFVNKKGEEKLQFVFYPCRPKITNTASRDITVVPSENVYGNVSFKYVENIPHCELTDNSIEYTYKNGKTVSMSRDIVTTHSEGGRYKYANATYDSGSLYTIKRMNVENVQPITAIIRLMHK